MMQMMDEMVRCTHAYPSECAREQPEPAPTPAYREPIKAALPLAPHCYIDGQWLEEKDIAMRIPVSDGDGTNEYAFCKKHRDSLFAALDR